jgi:hypothetical protein
MRLIDDWKKAPRMISMHCMTYALAIQAAWVAIPAELQALVHPIIAHAITGVLLVAGIVGRLVQQAPKDALKVTIPDDNSEHA